MKKQIKKIFLSISLLFSLQCNISFPAAVAQQKISPMQSLPAQGMPSVADVFGNMSEDEIIKQVQEAQKFFQSLSPEEMVELEKMVAQTLDTMSPQDLEDIQGIAKMVEPHIEIPKEADKKDMKAPLVKDSDISKKKEKSDVIDTSDIKELLSSINNQIDEIFQKSESSKEALEEIRNKWSSKVTLDNMKRNIVSLKEDRLLKKLSSADNKEDKDLVDKIKNFHKDLTKHNDNYKIEDTFGVPVSRTIETKNLKKTQELLSMFENHIDEVMPSIEKFLRKYDPEALEMAKEASERAKKASLHEKDAEIRRASPITATSASRSQYPSSSSYSTSRSTGYDPYAYPEAYDTYRYPDARQQVSPGSMSKKVSEAPLQTTGKSQSNESKKDDNKQNKTDVVKNTTFDQIINLLEGHKEDYADKYVEKFKDFLKKDLDDYPSIPKSSQDQDDWLESKNNYQNKGFTAYAKKMIDTASIYEKDELTDMKDMLDEVIAKIPNMDPEQTHKLINHNSFNHIKHRIENYIEHFEKAAKKTIETFDENLKRLQKHPQHPQQFQLQFENKYKNLHEKFISTIEHKIMDHLTTLMYKVEKIKKRAKHHRRSKAGQHIPEAFKI